MKVFFSITGTMNNLLIPLPRFENATEQAPDISSKASVGKRIKEGISEGIETQNIVDNMATGDASKDFNTQVGNCLT